jgi:H+-transporting ATPase
MVLKQLQGPMPYMIEAATVLSAVLAQWAPFGILIAILIINTAIGFHEEKKAKDALDGLKNSLVSTVPCRRNGVMVTLDVTELVPLDIVFLRGGNIVPADCKWLEGDVFQVDTAALTGEALPRKVPSDQYGPELLSGCVVKQGEGFCVVEKTGVHTEIGTGMVAIQANAGVEMGFFEKQIMTVVAGIIAITLVDIVVLTLFEVMGRGHKMYGAGNESMLLWDLAIMVAAVPIALPLVIQVETPINPTCHS